MYGILFLKELTRVSCAPVAAEGETISKTRAEHKKLLSRGCRLSASRKSKNGSSAVHAHAHHHDGSEISCQTSTLDTSEFDLKECIFLEPDGTRSKVPRGEFELQLSADMKPVTFILTPDNTGELEHSTFASHGHSLVEGGADSLSTEGIFSNGQANIVIGKDGKTMAGSVQMDGKMFQLLTMEDGTTNVVEINLEDLPENEVDSVLDPADNAIEHSKGLPNLPSSQARSTTKGSEPNQNKLRGLAHETSFIDVLVPYTKRAVCQLALSTSTTRCVMTPSRIAAMEARIDLAVYESNIALANSGLPGRFRLAHAFLVDEEFDEEGMKYSEVIKNAAFPSDFVIDEIPVMREKHGADVVAMIVDNPLSCGLAYGGKPVASQWAFAVVNVMCMVGYYSFVHEIAHTLGAIHDRPTHKCDGAKCCGDNCSNFAYQDPRGRFRSIMAYSCLNNKNCPRVQFFSQPDLKYVPDQDFPNVSHAIGSATENNAAQIAKTWDQASGNFPTKFLPSTPSPTASPTAGDTEAPSAGIDPCGDGICDGENGEDCKTCPVDCIGGIFEGSECGNGWCEDGETCHNCPADCASRTDPSLRGNYCCEGGPVTVLTGRGLNGVSCSNSYCNFNIQCDLAARSGNPTYCCGNGTCELGESVVTCPSDCECIDNDICEIFEDATCTDCQDMERKQVCLGNDRACVGIKPVPCCGECVDKKCAAKN